jgi:hypothetical protein
MPEYVENPVTGNYGVDVDGTVKQPAPAPTPPYFRFSYTEPPDVVFQGWLLNGAYNDDPPLPPGGSLQAFYPEPQFIPASAGESPGEGYRFTVVRVVKDYGWPTQLELGGSGL